MVFIPGLSNSVFDPYSAPPAPQRPLGDFQSGGLPVNVLQELQQPEPVAVTRAATAMDQRPNFQVPDMPLPEVKPPRPRMSLIDTIGGLADVFARMGGAEPLYQPTLDAREDRARQIDIEAMKRQQMEQQLAMGGEEAAALQRQKAGVAMKGLQAIAARGGDVNAAWPILARQAGIKPEDAAVLGDAISKDPNALPAIAAMFGQEQEFGLQPFYAQDAQGNLQAYQIGKDGSLQPISLPNGSQPVDPLKFVDVGNQQVGVGSRTGRPVRIIPKGVDPNTGARIRSSERIAGANIASRERIAASKGQKGGDPAAARSGLALLDSIQRGFDNLHKLGALPGEGDGVIGQVSGMIGRTGVGQAIGATMGLPAAQERELLAKNLANLQSDLIKTLPGAATRTKFEQEIQKKRLPDPATMSYETANRAIKEIRETYQQVLDEANAKKSAPRIEPRRTPARSAPRGGSNPSVSNW